jgi:prefoldin subunit 5
MATKTKKSSSARSKKPQGLVGAAVAATVELGHAAESLQESFDHVSKARQKARPVTTKVARTAKKAKKAVASTAKRVMKKRKTKKK